MTTQSGSGKNTGRTTATDANGTAPPSPPESGDPKANGAAKPKKPVSAAQQSRDEATVEVPDVPVASASSAASSPSANDTVIDLDTSAVTGKSPGGSGKAPGTSGPSGSSGPGKGPGGPGAGQTPGTGPGSGKPPAGAVPPAQNATPPALEKTTPDGSGPSSSGSAPGGVGGASGAGGLGGKPAAPGIAPVKDGPAVPGSDWSQPQEPAASMFAGRNDSASPRSSSGGTATATKERRGGVGAAVARVTGGGSGKSPRRAQLQLARLEPWSVMKFSFVMSLVCFVVLLVAVTVLYMILSGLGVFDTIATTVNDLTREQGEQSGGLDAGNWFSFVRIFGYTVLVGALNVLLITALSTVGSVIYNLAADLVGGIEVTLKEAE